MAACLLAVSIPAALLLPRLGSGELRVEEGRRAWTARTMLATGDWVVPRIWGRPYLSKPPLHPWAIALASAPAERVTPLTARLPSALASLVLVLGVLSLAWRRLGPRPALVAALLVAGAPLFLEKGRLGEIEALFSLCCFLAVGGLGLALERPRWIAPALGAGLALGAALLAKGPPALVFVLGAAGGLWWLAPHARARLARAGALVLATGLGVAGIWVLALLSVLPSGSTLAHWGSELLTQGRGGPWSYLRERPAYVAASLLGLAPASLVLLLPARRGGLGELAAQPLTRLALCASLPVWLLFLLVPGTTARYVFPILPWVALLGAASLEPFLEGAQGAAARRVRRLAWLVAILLALSALLALAASSAWVRARGFDPFGLASLGLGPGAVPAALAALAGPWVAMRYLRRRSPAKTALALLLALAGLAAWNQEATDLRRSLRHQAHLAERIEAHLPAGERLHVALWDEFNLLFLLERELVHVSTPAETPPGGYLLLPWPATERLQELAPERFEPLLLLEGPRSGPLELLGPARGRDG